MVKHSKNLVFVVIGVVIVAVVGVSVNRKLSSPKLPNGFTSGNGRIEATEVDVATKLPGRLLSVLVKEGDTVTVGQEVARMETRELDADLKGAHAQLKQAEESKKYATAVVSQLESELSFADKQYKRTVDLTRRKLASKEQLDRDLTNFNKADAAFRAAKYKVSEAAASIETIAAKIEKLKTQIDESVLKSTISGRVLYRLAEPGEVLAAGGHVLTLINLTEVYMTIFLPTKQAGKVSINAEARIIIDARPELRIPAKVSFVAPQAQFTPKEVETQSEREKLMFRVKVKIPPDLLKKHIQRVKTGVTGVSYIQLDPKVPWPEHLKVKLPQ